MDVSALPPLALATYIALLLGVVGLWLSHRLPYLWGTFLAASVALGYSSGILTGWALIPIIFFAIACRLYRQPMKMKTRGARIVLAAMILVVGLLLGVGAFPGFHNPAYADQLRLSANAAPFTAHLDFNKTAVGLLLLGLCYRGLIARGGEWREALRLSWAVIAINVLIVIALALATGFVRPDSKWTTFFFPWAVVNLFFVCMSEEAFFRGFIQKELAAAFANSRYGQAIAVATSAILFGAVHFAGGLTYVFLAMLAGAGYAIVFQRSGRIEMSMLAHFLLNATHFLLLTYPTVA